MGACLCLWAEQMYGYMFELFYICALHVCFVLWCVPKEQIRVMKKPWWWKWKWIGWGKEWEWEELKVNNAENKLSISFNLLAARFSQRHRYKTNICKVITKASANALSHSPLCAMGNETHRDRGWWQNELTTDSQTHTHTHMLIHMYWWYLYSHVCIHKQNTCGLLRYVPKPNRWDWLWLS